MPAQSVAEILPPKVPPATSSDDEESPGRAATRIAALWKQVRTPSYAIEAAKEVALRDTSRPSCRTSGDYGQKWGTAIHHLLELSARDPSRRLDGHARRLAEELDLGIGSLGEMLETVDSVRASEMWQRAVAAEQRYTEIPFESVEDREGVPVITKGVIDLVFREPDGWIVVDYKTDDLSADDVGRALRYYDKQLAYYARFWERATRQPFWNVACTLRDCNGTLLSKSASGLVPVRAKKSRTACNAAEGQGWPART